MTKSSEDKQLERIEKLLKTINEKLSLLIAEKNLETKRKVWVKGDIVKEFTGWNKSYLLKARRNSFIEYRQVKPYVVEYNLNSIPDMYLIKK